MPWEKVSANARCLNAATSACERSCQWELAVALLRLSHESMKVPDQVAFNAAICACDKAGKLEVGLAILKDSQAAGIEKSLYFFAGASARLGMLPPEAIQAFFSKATRQLQAVACSSQELSLLAWAAAMLGVSNPLFTRVFAEQVLSQLPDFKVDELLLVAWSAAAHDKQLLLAVQDEAVARLGSGSGLKELALGTAWACNFAGFLRQRLWLSAGVALRHEGVVLGVELGIDCLQPGALSGRTPKSRNAVLDETERDTADPSIALSLPDRVAARKPPNWEVSGEDSELQLLTFLRSACGQPRLLMDSQQDFGILHRLDIPSSGLILAAKTHEAYFDLQLQLGAGKISREYTVLCHGWMPPGLDEIDVRVHWRSSIADIPTTAGGHGKPSRTLLKLTMQAVAWATAVSLVTVCIVTGRRHQIRSHFSHVGHPTVADTMYSAHAVWRFDTSWCKRNYVHRHGISLLDSSGRLCRALAKLPADLVGPLEVLMAKDELSAILLRRITQRSKRQ
eukprot:TRINITY_DN39426_c0_g1_i1.p1 TRINITY_DN39426_c0_g1~~TRINITY_DN39426_c0_g1_i1.p1  ORF type:complete len:509 (-),score=104.56 TRINITY_DN39426_c0_g1_i1:145-1671(-)